MGNTIDNGQFQEMVIEYLQGRLSEEQQARIDAVCRENQQYQKEFENIRQYIDSLPPKNGEVPPDFILSVNRKIDGRTVPLVNWFVNQTRLIVSLEIGGAAAAVVLLIMLFSPFSPEHYQADRSGTTAPQAMVESVSAPPPPPPPASQPQSGEETAARQEALSDKSSATEQKQMPPKQPPPADMARAETGPGRDETGNVAPALSVQEPAAGAAAKTLQEAGNSSQLSIAKRSRQHPASSAAQTFGASESQPLSIEQPRMPEVPLEAVVRGKLDSLHIDYTVLNDDVDETYQTLVLQVESSDGQWNRVLRHLEEHRLDVTVISRNRFGDNGQLRLTVAVSATHD